MRHVALLLMACIFLLLINIFKKHREIILIVAILILSAISGIYCYKNADGILSKRQPVNQTFYDTKYIDTCEFPDAFLRLFLKGKTVYVKSDRLNIEEAEGQGFEWQYAYYHVENMVSYLNSIDAIPVEDSSYNDVVISKEKAKDFERLGYLNDLLRNSMMRSKYDDDSGSFFFYLWYYRDLAKTSYLYLHEESLNEDELVLIWQPQNEDEPYTEDMYLMGKSYYEENIK